MTSDDKAQSTAVCSIRRSASSTAFLYLMSYSLSFSQRIFIRFFGIGKGIALKKMNQEYLKAQGQLFMNTTSSKLDVIKAGEEALTCVYRGLPLEFYPI
jgi:hypothetical protein